MRRFIIIFAVVSCMIGAPAFASRQDHWGSAWAAEQTEKTTQRRAPKNDGVWRPILGLSVPLLGASFVGGLGAAILLTWLIRRKRSSPSRAAEKPTPKTKDDGGASPEKDKQPESGRESEAPKAKVDEPPKDAKEASASNPPEVGGDI